MFYQYNNGRMTISHKITLDGFLRAHRIDILGTLRQTRLPDSEIKSYQKLNNFKIPFIVRLGRLFASLKFLRGMVHTVWVHIILTIYSENMTYLNNFFVIIIIIETTGLT